MLSEIPSCLQSLPLSSPNMNGISSIALPLEETGLFSSIFIDFIEQRQWLDHFQLPKPDLQGLLQVAQDAEWEKFDRKLLLNTLTAQYRELEESGTVISEAVKDNLEALSSPDSRTITTGQQLHPATGPLYVVFKILSTLNLCKQLNAVQQQHRFIPVFWLASEDHDLQEVRELQVAGKTYTWLTEQSGPTGRISCKGLPEMLEQLKTDLGARPGIDKLLADVFNAYKSEYTLSLATRKLIHEWFGKAGLLMIDPDAAALKRSFIPVMQRDITRQEAPQAAKRLEEELSTHGSLPLSIRSVNLFYLGEQFRLRIDTIPGGFRTPDERFNWTPEQLSAEIEAFPQRFSPNVVLRPLYQQSILPNVAYIGGPAEVVYWLQLRGVFQLHDIPFPVLLPRAHAVLVDNNLYEKFRRMGFAGKDWLEKPDELIARWMNARGITTEVFDQARKQTTLEMDALTGFMEATDKTLGDAGRAEKVRMLQAIDKLEEKWKKSQKRSEDQSVQVIRKVRDRIFPNGTLQERHDNILGFIGSGDLQHPMDLLEHMDPLKKSLNLICY